MSNWIKTKDRLPAILENVLFMVENEGVYLGWIDKDKKWTEIDAWNIIPNSRVKAWCPIPEYDLKD